jgi:hypothetical protein
MLKNPTKKANANALVAHLGLIQRYSKEDLDQKPLYNPVINDYVQVDVPPNVDETTMRKRKSLTSQQPDILITEADEVSLSNLGFEGLSQDDKVMSTPL